MNKKLKAKIIKHNQEMRAAFPSLYDQRWVEKAADEGWKEVVDGLSRQVDGFMELAEGNSGTNILATLYYSAFENALNTFIKQCLDDSLTTVELCMNELQKVTASIKTSTLDFSGTKPGV